MNLQPLGRFDWERIIRRLKIPRTRKLVAFTLATYANADGTRVRPGVKRLAAVTGTSPPTVKRALHELRKDGLINEMVSGSRLGEAGRSSEYRLTVPVDLLDRLPMLDPDEHDQGSPASPALSLVEPAAVGKPPEPGLTSDHTRAHPEQDEGSFRGGAGLTGDIPPEQDQTRHQPETRSSDRHTSNARENEDDEARRYAAAARELSYLPDFGVSLIEDVRRTLPGDPDYQTLVITAGGIARERRRTA